MRRTLLRIFFFVAVCAVILYSRTYVSGPPYAYTNAPSESNCTTSGCHSTYSLQTSGTNWGRISMTSNFTGNGYIPDSVYTITVAYKESGISRFGFEITALDGSNLAAGKFATVDSRTYASSTTVGGKTRYYAEHSYTGSSGVATDSTSWKIKWTAPSSSVGNIKFYVTLNSANNNGSETGDYIYAKTFTVGLSSYVPTAKAKVVDSVICANASLTFKATVTGNPTSYNWSFPSGSPSTSTSSSPVVSYSTSGIYKAIVTVKNSKASSKTDTLTFVVNPAASAVSVTPSGTVNICKGDSIKLTATQLANYSYKWSPTAETSRIINAKDSALYYVTVKNTYKCTAVSNKVMVKTNRAPQVSISKSISADTICEGTPFYVQGNVLSGVVDSWSFASIKGPFVKSDTHWLAPSAGNLTANVWGKSSVGCKSSAASLNMVANAHAAAPSLSVTNVSYTGFRVNWTSVAGATGYKVSVDSGQNYITPSAGNMGLYHDLTGLLGNHSQNVMVYAILNDVCGQSATASIVGKTSTCLPLDFTVSANKTRICKNGSTNIILHKLNGKNIAVTINGTYKGTDTIQPVTIGGTTDFSVGVLDSGALICGYTYQNITIHEDTINNAQWFADTAYSVCSNNASVPLGFNAKTDKTIDTFLFYQNTQLVNSSASFSYTFNLKNNDVVSLLGKNKNGCYSASGPSTKMHVIPLPNAKFNTTPNHYLYSFKALQKNGNHQWSLDTFAPGNTDSFKVNLTGWDNKTLKVYHTIKVDGCTSKDSGSFTVPDFVGVKSNAMPEIAVFPNPANNDLFVNLQKNNGVYLFELWNTQGQFLFRQKLQPGINQINVNELAQGTYFYKIIGENAIVQNTLCIMR